MKKPAKPKKPRRGRSNKQKPREFGPFVSALPFHNLDDLQRRAMASAIASSSKVQFEKSLKERLYLAQTASPLHVIAMLNCYALMAPVDVAAKAGNGPTHDSGVQQGHLEYLQALMLRESLQSVAPPDPPLSQRFFDALPALFNSYGLMQMPFDKPSRGDGENCEQVSVQLVQSFLRNHTASVRNWGYFSKVKQITIELHAPLDDEFKNFYGLTLTQLVGLFEHLIRRAENDVSEKYLRRVQRIYAGLSAKEIAKTLGEEFAEFQGVDVLQAQLSQPGINVDDARFAVFMAAESILPTLFIIDSGELSLELSLDTAVVEKILSRLSLSFGSLSDSDPESLILDNPVWGRPLIQLGEQKYFCAIPQTLMSFVLRIIDDLISPFADLKEKLQKRRSAYLELQSERSMQAAFPGCQISRGYKWMEGARQYENDLALRYDTTIILVESKSGAITWPALRGAPNRVIRHINELIVGPSDQSGRLSHRLREAISDPESSMVSDFPLPLDGVQTIIRLSLTLQDFATLQSVPSLMADAGLINSKYPLAPCLTVSDLEVVTQILDEPFLRLHYLRRRAELLPKISQIGDELDSLGFYLDTGFNLGEVESGGSRLVMPGYSGKIDRYFTYIDEQRPSIKPKPNLSPWIFFICEQLRDRGSVGWTEIAFHLLCLTREEQEKVESKIRTIQRKISSKKTLKHGHNALILVPANHRRVALVFYVRMPDGESSGESAKRFAGLTFDTEHVEMCAVMGFNPDEFDRSYRSSALMYRTDRAVQVCTFL